MNLKKIAAGLAVSGGVATAMTFGGGQASAEPVTFYGCVFPYYGVLYFVTTNEPNPGACGPGAPISFPGDDEGNPLPPTGSSGSSGSSGGSSGS
ncbi:hypothetical protein ACFYVR_19460 [Rhodococcus sp. NPDC003318]|uniref:hypothetical protein n=1 Tax=Rhodococcus sp. NPDC003318 TaxID=3364503 RepID=UPI00367BA20D